MKKFLLLAFSLFLVTFSGCGDDDPEDSYSIYISGVQGDSYSDVTEIRAKTTTLGDVIAKTNRKGSSTTIELPEKVSSRYLVNIGDTFESEYFEVSDQSVQWTELIQFVGYDSGGDEVGVFFQINSPGANVIQYVLYAYSATEVTVKGDNVVTVEGAEISMEVNFTLKKGWNRYSQKQYYDKAITEDDLQLKRITITNTVSGSVIWGFNR